MSYQRITYEKRDRVALIVLNRPEVLNAMDPLMGDELVMALKEAREDKGVGCVVITGAGRAFCSGADVKVFRQMIEGQVQRRTVVDEDLFDVIFDHPKPIIAAVNGPAVGIGATMTLPCDIRLASEQARFGFIFARVGLILEFGSTFLLPRIIGLGKALELAMTARLIDAHEAKEIGLVSQVFPQDRFLEEVMAYASQIANGPTRTLGWMKEAVHRSIQADLPTARRIEGEILDRCRRSPEHREGVMAFLEKRQPRWAEIAEQS
ncbi:MAG: enoyl-CoA hydratase/isomerase family protein [Dehalococcoidia bacterium]|jgi:2-(1,2-epoxy-1,2-dihydrophenyl)acetyl-CoA isomerase|nr:enoyl-CoA hydratase/isomerase family protein [Dehalococcoidia bacterium]